MTLSHSGRWGMSSAPPYNNTCECNGLKPKVKPNRVGDTSKKFKCSSGPVCVFISQLCVLKQCADPALRVVNIRKLHEYAPVLYFSKKAQLNVPVCK